MDKLYGLMQADEDGRHLRIKSETELKEVLDNPEEWSGITEFKDAAWLVENPDPNYWPEGVAVLLSVRVIVPVPAGQYVLPEFANA
jgi:hypothetical protein